MEGVAADHSSRIDTSCNSFYCRRVLQMEYKLPEKGTIAGGTAKLVFGEVPPELTRLNRKPRFNGQLRDGLFARAKKPRLRNPSLPAEDNTPEGLKALLSANHHYRQVPWPEPYHRTTHRLHHGDARNLAWIPNGSVHLVVTSPPYWTLKDYAPGNEHQMGHFEDYEH